LSHVRAPPRESSDLAQRIEGDYGDARFIEDSMIQLHQLHESPVPTSDLRGRVLSEHWHFFAIRRANMHTKVSLNTVFAAVRRNGSGPGTLLAVSHGNSPQSSIRRNARRLSPSKPCQPGSAASNLSPRMDFTGYWKIVSACPISIGMLDPNPRNVKVERAR
jgi:hypothetical protein